MMLSIIVLLQLLRSSSAGLGTSDSCLEVSFISRTDWNASEPIVERSNIYRGRFPLPYFFVHHTAWIYDAKDALSEWKDIGYNFLVDEAGNVYEGRGWRKVGAHTLGFNCNAFAVSVMGRYSQRLPGKKATDAIQKLIQCGVEEEHLHKDYILQGHRDSKCTATECPGERLYKEIKTWPHYPNRALTHLIECGVSQEDFAQIKWMRKKGASDKAGVTGPLADRSSDGNGFYLLVDASNSKGKDAVAILYSASSSSSLKCMVTKAT
ncbi:PGPLE-like protein [Mya arenaria]|uniref:PGPLE-like protein n=1 Tax=Mya arenaria TaxID=6604 RepID=A0ABY7EQL6_MYAAR|nr:PGPLE-like protein [Mya arenaria]